MCRPWLDYLYICLSLMNGASRLPEAVSGARRLRRKWHAPTRAVWRAGRGRAPEAPVTTQPGRGMHASRHAGPMRHFARHPCSLAPAQGGLVALRKRRHARGQTGVRRGALVEGGGGSGRRCALIRFRRPRISWGPVVRWVAGARLASLHGDPARISTALPPHGCAARRCTGLGSSGGLCMQTSPGAPQRATQRCTAAWLLPVARCHSCDAAASSSRMQAQPRGPYCTRRAPQPGAAPGRGRRWPHTPPAAQRHGPPRGRSARRPPPPPARPPHAGRSPAGWAAAPAPRSWAPHWRRPRRGASPRAAARRPGAPPPGQPAPRRGPPGRTRPRRLRGRRAPSRRRRPRPCRRRR